VSLKELEKFLKLCRKQGVQSIRYEGIEVHLNEQPLVTSSKSRTLSSTKKSEIVAETFVPGGVSEDTKIQVDSLTPDQLLFWSTSQDASEQQ